MNKPKEKKKAAGQTKGRSSLIGSVGFFIALLSGLAALMSGPGTSFGLWNYQTGISTLRWAAYGGIAAAALSLIGLIASVRIVIFRGFFLALLGVIIGTSVVCLMLHWKEVAEIVPRIHDITTDTEHPPEYVAILALRKIYENSPVYGGPEVAAKQRKAYPDIVPLILPVSSDKAFDRALAVARHMDWKIIDKDKDSGRIEAVATTRWFRFKDDVVIRVRRQDSGSRVDIRSESRVGISDLGKNAERIRKFFKAMKDWQ